MVNPEAVLAGIVDPELPMVTLAELGVLRGVTCSGGRVEVELAPTYLGCPAIEVMADDIRRALRAHGAGDVVVRTVMSPPWTTDDITAEGRRKLAAAGIAPPRPGGPVFVGLPAAPNVRCPRCGSAATTLMSPFSGTACRALRRCEDCREPFDHVKER
ncbi:1,2-phenylacetyl-CoA epoxidase subunit PaaD [Streptomyces litchfieldiae]|uniref:1,2-phenylacetyl-CoA epoxidase subunit PaaD n=1 Tax=Streptomyces litchfieldiae TaxID=3075543 RepID=A0ABU2MMQ7_9ACTN|nr:1,2-phenylacetyl-CoA epoxidase subunit PaaD [Streptomyces sp. DSM 44938]MDT0342218.1 1,2-phenylacetyl-CoA epoxidase subunit PaaD [Streptomyces sp. DSM 44938]